MLDTESDVIEKVEDNTLNHPTDSVYSVMGIINKMQIIADRFVLLGEVRGDLITPTDAASADLKNLANFDFSKSNKYNSISDYYAVIQNCNYYLQNADFNLNRRGRYILRPEFAAVKAFRAWTYLQLAQVYGSVPLVLTPMLTERDAQNAMNGRYYNIEEICNYFINDLTPYAYYELPQYGTINGFSSRIFFLPMRVLLGDLCLWAGRYKEAANWYHDYITDKDNPRPLRSSRVYWSSPTDLTRPVNSYGMTGIESIIPMETRAFDGNVSDLGNVFNSTYQNNYYYQVTLSEAMRELSKAQEYCMEIKTNTRTDTVYIPKTGFSESLLIGDLRLWANYGLVSYGVDDYSEYSTMRQIIGKYSSRVDRVPTTRLPIVYLHYAEALNRAGYPQSAFSILKYGLCEDNLRSYVDTLELKKAGELLTFDEEYFTQDDALGIHSYGSGAANANAHYVVPVPSVALPTYQDTVAYQIPLVEDMIIDELALEGSFEGYRFSDLMRVALRRNDASYVADRVANRDGKLDAALRTKLMDKSNWYLPKP
jgi:hypothetical protein